MHPIKASSALPLLGKTMLRLKKIFIENSGPIEMANISFSLNNDQTPKPIVLVGENGTGKTTALSFIVDSLLQLASKKFDNVLAKKGSSTLYYRLRSHDMRIGSTTSTVHAIYELNNIDMHYVDRLGSIQSPTEINGRLGLPDDITFNPKRDFEKIWSGNTDDAAQELSKGAYIYFPSGRREVPHWLQPEALDPENYTTSPRYSNRFNKSIVVDSASEETAIWIMDCLVDKAAGYQDSGIHIANRILQYILEDETAHFAIAPRNMWPRIQIYTGTSRSPSGVENENPRRMRIPSIAHLSAGQSMLLSMFGTIANQGTLQQTKPLDQIAGIVVIDEAEVYLHTHLQRSVLPKLLKLFPKVQFIITSHSPSFLIGMKDNYGENGFDVLSMPSGISIDVNQFNEISAAVDSLRETSAFKNQVKAQIISQNEGPLLIVEGRSDAIFIENLWLSTYGQSAPFRIMSAKGRRALRYLLEDEEFIREVGATQRVLGLFDFDEAFDDWNGCRATYPIREGSESTGLLRRHAQKEIYTALLPIPGFRANQAQESYGAKSKFTIELYIPDNILNEGNNLSHEIFPGGFQASIFCGDKVNFAKNISEHPEMAPHFNLLLDMVRSILDI